jgi:DNA polymerase I-like protein with 3'-5' exonuclease and polymerase domains
MHYVTEPTQYLQALKALEGSERLALDTETNVQKEWETKGGSALDPHTGEVSLLIVSKPKERPFIFDNHWLRHHGVDFSPLFNILTAAEYFIGANLKFDLKMMRSTFGVMPENVRDVILMAKMISNATGSKVGKQHGHSYADLCREYLDVHLSGKKDLRVSTWGIGLEGRTLESSWWREKLEYGARDVQYLFDLNDLMEKAICTPLPSSPLIQNDNFSTEWGLGMEKVMKIEHEFLPVVAQMEYRGMPVSETTMSLFQSAISEKLIQTAVLLSRELELDEPQKDWRGQEVPSAKALKTLRSSQGLLGVIQKALNFRRLDNVQAEVLKRMIEIMDKLAAVPTENLEDVTPDPIFIDEAEEDLYGELQELEASTLVEKSPLIKAILTFKQCTKQEGMDLRKFLNPKTGRLHYGLNQIGAATNRSSSSGPNMQQISGRVTAIVEEDLKNLFVCSSRAV